MGLQGPPEQGPKPAATSCAQERSHIEVFVRPLADEACAIVFFSRRTDLPHRYRCSLAKLNLHSSSTYEVSALLGASGLPGRVLLAGPLTHGLPKLWASCPPASARGAAAGAEGGGWWCSLHRWFHAAHTELLHQ